MSLLKLASELEELQESQEPNRSSHNARNIGIGVGVGASAGVKPAKSLKRVKYNPITGGIGGAVGGASAIIGNKMSASRDARRAERYKEDEADASNDVPTENEL